MADVPHKLLLVEDNPGDALLLTESLAASSAHSYSVTHVETLAEAVSSLAASPADIVLLDLSLPDSQGLSTLRQMLSLANCPAVVVLTGYDDESVGLEAVRLGAQDYLVKGKADAALLLRTLAYSVHRKELVSQLEKARAQLELRVQERTCELRQAVEVLQEEVTARMVVEQALRRTNVALQMVTECDKALVRAEDEICLLDETCRIISDVGGYSLVLASLVVYHTPPRVVPVAMAGGVLESIGDLHLACNDACSSEQGPTAAAICSRQAMVCNDLAAASASEPWHETARQLGCQSALALPLRRGSEVLGALTIYDARPEAFPQNEIELLLELADDLAFGVNSLRLRQQRTEAQNALQHSNELLERMFSNTHTLVAYIDRQYNFIRVNKRYAEADGWDEAFFAGKNHFDLYPDDEHRRIFDQVVETGTPFSVYERPFIYPHNPQRGTTWWNWSVVPVKDASGAVEGLVLSLLDVTEPVRNREALRESERKAQEARLQLAAIVESSEDAIFSVTLDGTITHWNSGAQRIWGYRAADIVGRSISRLLPISRLADLQDQLRKVFAGQHVCGFDTMAISKSRRRIHLSISMSAMRDADDRVVGASLIARDVTSQKRMEKEVLQIIDEERQRARYELHERLAQRLSGASFFCQAMVRQLDTDGSTPDGIVKLAESAQKVEAELRGAVAQTRALAQRLMPVPPTPEGLMDALHELARQTEQVHSVTCEFRCERSVALDDVATANQLYRVAEEAISNAVLHAKARTIQLELARHGDSAQVTICDDGAGVSAVTRRPSKARGRSAGMGIQVMTYRANSIGGSLAIRRGQKGGTVVRVCAPVSSPRSIRGVR